MLEEEDADVDGGGGDDEHVVVVVVGLGPEHQSAAERFRVQGSARELVLPEREYCPGCRGRPSLELPSGESVGREYEAVA